MKYLMYILLTFSTLHISAEIKEITKMEELYPHVTQDTLLIFDIDNTLIEPAQTLGSDQWFCHLIQIYREQGLNQGDALKRALREWSAVQHVTQVQLCETHTPGIIGTLQEQNIPIIGLTTRNLGLAHCTLAQLHSCGINFKASAPSHKELHFMNHTASKEFYGVLFKEGVLFTAGTDKGEALRQLLHAIQYHPKNVIFINDKASHLKEIERYCEEAHIPFIGLRYGYTDPKVKNFRKELAEVQHKHFGRIMSDDEAEALLKNTQKI